MQHDGYTDLPPGKLANVVVYLEMRSPPPKRPSRSDLSLAPFEGDLDGYRRLYRRVGEPWLWFSRLEMGDAGLAALLADPLVETMVLRDATGSIGLLELDFREPTACEVTFFGVVPEAIGTGAGRFLMGEAIARAWSRPIARLWLHTCTLDHPGAVAFYERSGFKPYKLAVEVHDDPRLLGLLPRSAAPHVPVIDPR